MIQRLNTKLTEFDKKLGETNKQFIINGYTTANV